MKLSKLLLVISGVALVAGCAGATEDNEATDAPPKSQEDSSESPNSTRHDATTEQWASLVARKETAIRESHNVWENSECRHYAVTDECKRQMDDIGNAATGLVTVITNGKDVEHDDYIGDPPAEIADLLDDTLLAAEASANSTTTLIEDWDSESGQAGRVDTHAIYGLLIENLDGWKPYN